MMLSTTSPKKKTPSSLRKELTEEYNKLRKDFDAPSYEEHAPKPKKKKTKTK